MRRAEQGVIESRFVKIVFVCSYLFGLLACQASPQQRSPMVTLSNDDYNKIELNSDTQNLCSPDMSSQPDFIGIVIQAPTEVVFEIGKPASDKAFMAMPLCGFYQLDMADLLADSKIHLFAKNIETDQIYRGIMTEQDPGTEEPLPFDEPELQAEDVRGQLLGAYFNPNIAKYILLPVEAASYKVLVQIGNFKSNVVDINVKQKD